MDKRVLITLVAVIVLGLILRLSTLHNVGYAEPDAYYYASILQQAHGLSLPNSSLFDSASVQEAHGLYYIVLLPHVLLGISIYTAVRLAAPLLWIIEAFLVFALAKQLTKKDAVAILAVLILALSLPNLAKTSAGNYRGDAFVSVFLLLGLVLFFEARRKEDIIEQFIFAACSGLSIALCMAVWSGGSFAVPIFIATLTIAMLFDLKGNKNKIIYPWLVGIIALSAGTIALFNYNLISHSSFSYLNIGAARNFSQQSAGAGISISELQRPTLIDYIGAYNLQLLSPALAFIAEPLGSLAVISLAGLLCLGLFYYKRKEVDLVVALSITIWFLLTAYFTTDYVRYLGLNSIPLAILSAYCLWLIVDNEKIKAMNLHYMILAFVFLVMIFFALFYAANINPADSITPSFLQAAGWLEANSPANSIVLTLWPDGSVLEYYHLFSLSDSVPGLQNVNTTNWFFTNNQTISFKPMPNYIFIRNVSLNESEGFCLTVEGVKYLNCTLLETSKGINVSYLQAKQPNFYKLIQAKGNISIGNTSLSLVYSNADSKIFKVN